MLRRGREGNKNVIITQNYQTNGQKKINRKFMSGWSKVVTTKLRNSVSREKFFVTGWV